MNSKVAYWGIYTALALIFSYVEMLIPIHFAVPGVKLGLANVVIVVVLYKMGRREAYIISVTRVILAGFLFGNMASIIFSLAGCIFSLTIMSILYKKEIFGIIGVSVMGAVFHYIGQVLVAMVVVNSFSIIYYFSLLMIAGVVTGVLIGIVAQEMIKRIPV